MVEDLWRLAVDVFQAWVFVVLFLIMLPAMFGLSLGVTGVYIQILVKVLEVPDKKKKKKGVISDQLANQA